MVRLGVVTVGLGIASSSLGQGTLRFELADECRSEELFWRQLAARLDQGEPQVRLGEGAVRVFRDGTTFVGRLELSGAPTREVRGETCDEVMVALALVAAWRLRQSEAPARLLEPPSDPLAPVPEPPAQPRPPPADPTTTPRPPPVLEPALPPTGQTRHPRSARVSTWRAHDRWVVGLGAFAVSGASPTVLGGPIASLERVRGGRIPWSLVGTAEFGASPRYERGPGISRFRFWVGKAAACIEAGTLEPFSLWPCFELSGGATEAIGDELDQNRRVLQGWLAGGPLLRARLLLGQRFGLDVAGGAALTALWHETWFENPDYRVHRTDPGSLSTEVRVTYRLP
ncbi:MAG: hypothetical protein JW751_02965 [Polyangiaceae bacterium]|nr:hypothetical protein [Polyangiaceae bacterium]